MLSIDTLINEAEELLESDPSQYQTATFNLKAAIEGIRRIGNNREKADQIYTKLLEVQQLGKDQFEEYSTSLDLTDFAIAIIEKIKGKNFQDALFTLALIEQPPKIETLRISVENIAKEAPLFSTFPIDLVDNQGKVKGHRSPLLFSDPENIDKAVRAEMFFYARQYHGMYVMGIIEPGRRQIVKDHYFSINELSFLVLNNPFIPHGHEAVFAQGLFYGLKGDFILSNHLLIPQVENSLRYILTQNRVITSTITDQQIQEDFRLGQLLYKAELQEILGKDLVFDLQGLLIEKFGSNLRNRLSHGLMSINEMYSYDFVYLWWLMLRICAIPIYNKEHQIDKNKKTLS